MRERAFASPFHDLLPALKEALANVTRADVFTTVPYTAVTTTDLHRRWAALPRGV
ncbi:hypothetical protein FHR32_002179 [Streptosporangium album]|uniref:Uncharacterized protein n=1 Tax=Streptosporangium album TaxID=47479 RepID=A0A7W7W9A6_9ACTN|nr:hypothetical protein [Streptosporangium album]MBB4937874.1 hypothetical protein [Streptosporangium album]